MWVDNKQGVKCLETGFEDIETCTVGKKTNICKKQKFSRYYLTGMYSTLCDIQTDTSILCVGYTGGDMQFTVTGTCHFGEDEETAVSREIMEEVGIDFDATKLLLHSYGFIENQETRSAVFSLCIDDCRPRPLSELPQVFRGRYRDDKRRKVSVIIYGKRENLRSLMEMARPLIKNEGINYYGSVPHLCAKFLIKKFKDVTLDGLQIEGYDEAEEKKRKRLSVQKNLFKKARVVEKE